MNIIALVHKHRIHGVDLPQTPRMPIPHTDYCYTFVL